MIKKAFLIFGVAVGLLAIITPTSLSAQDINLKIGHRDSLPSKYLKETRSILVHLPDGYQDSNKSYPVLYRLDGNTDLLLETVSTLNRLTYGDEIVPEMIIVAIENTQRYIDMWPVNTQYNPKPTVAGASSFLDFIEKELIPYVEDNYRTNQEKTLCGQSLSGMFSLYAFLSKPALFNSYLVSSGAFPDCENYFKELSEKAFQQADQFNGLSFFMTNGSKDPLDPDGSIKQNIMDFYTSLEHKLGNRLRHKYVEYENEGHVPYHSLYDGLRFIYQKDF